MEHKEVEKGIKDKLCVFSDGFLRRKIISSLSHKYTFVI